MSSKVSWWNLGILALAIGFSPLVSADETTYSLVYKFQPGQFSQHDSDDWAEMTMQNANVRDKDGQPLESKSVQKTQTQRSFRVVMVDESGGATLEPVVEKVRMTAQAGDRSIVSYDSTNGETPPKEFEKIAGTLGRPMARFQVAPNGRLLKVILLIKDVPKNFSDAAEKLDPAINFLVLMPEKPVKIGDKWSEKFDTLVSVGSGLHQTVTLIRTFELIAVVDNVAKIRSRTNLLTPTDDPEILRQLVQMTPTGIVEFDIGQGRLLSKSLRIDEKVVSAFGPQTLLQARGESLEKLIAPNSTGRLATGTPNTLPK